MNKTYLIVGGASVASLAVGATGGYFFAKKKFDKITDQLIADEVAKTKKYYSILLMQANDGKPDDPADLLRQDDEIEEDEQPSPQNKTMVERGKKALTDYQGISGEKAEKSTSAPIESNIFSEEAKRTTPPKDPVTGRFLPKTAGAEDDAKSIEMPKEETPYLVSEEDFLDNPLEHDQESVLYFRTANTLIMKADNEEVDIERIGAVNLTLFPAVPAGESSSIYVRNEGLGIDYDVTLTEDSLTAYMGLGEDDDPDIDEIDAANYAIDHS